AGLLGGLMLMASESPRWLMKAGKRKETKIALDKMVDSAAAKLEIQQIEQALNEEEGRWSELFTTGYRRALLIGVVLAAFGQLSGVNAILYYSSEIFKTAGATHDMAFLQTATIGLINFLFTLIAIACVDRAGRKTPLLIGTLIQAIALFFAGFLLRNNFTGPLLLLTVLVYIAAYAAAMGPITWLINSEIFPSKLRGRAMSIAILTLWAANFLVTQTFPLLNQTLGIAKTFWIYSLLNLLSFFFVLVILPETKNRTLEEIEHYWIARK
ncbi:MAG: arabinose-proton symporter, partial [Verrucomicrobia bacterium]